MLVGRVGFVSFEAHNCVGPQPRRGLPLSEFGGRGAILPSCPSRSEREARVLRWTLQRKRRRKKGAKKRAIPLRRMPKTGIPRAESGNKYQLSPERREAH